jgi:dipeptidyl aminopeptidase/acylaminoacyl peptidase
MFLPVVRKAFVALVLLPAFAIVAQDTKPPSREQVDQTQRAMDRGRTAGQVAISPDGKHLAWVQAARGGVEIHLAPLDDLKKFVRITAAASADQHCRESEFTWAPDSAALAFLSDCALSDGQSSGQMNLYLARIDGGTARRLTELRGEVRSPSFSPNGKAVAFLYVEGATRPAGALAAMKPPSGVIGEDGVEIQRVAVADADASEPATPMFATPANLHAYEFDWSPDSRSIAFVGADPPSENNWWVAKLYAQTLGGEPRVVLDPTKVSGDLHGMQIAVPRWSPDGQAIAFIGGLMSDQGVTGGDVWVVAAAGGQPHNLTPQRTSSPDWIAWDGNQKLFASEIAGGGSRLICLNLPGDPASTDFAVNSTSTVFSLPGTVSADSLQLSLSPSADRSLFVFRASSFSSPPEIFAAHAAHSSDSSPIAQLTHSNDGVQPPWGKTASLEWTSDTFRVQGWLIFPRNYDPAKKYPMIVEVHGGPAGVVMGRWSGGGGGFSATTFSAQGYFVLMPNPRGSYGQGEAFTQANRKDFGYGDLRDILAGVDTVLKSYPVDPNRVGLAGWSYGGFMTMFAVTQTHRFKAAVAGAGISDWLSYYGENSIDQWMIPYFGASVYDDPQVYARSSAITYIKQVTTPTLSVVGDRDGECPAPQSFEFWHALRDLHVPAQLVVYPNEGHGFVDPAHRRDVMDRAVDWFAKYMPPR